MNRVFEFLFNYKPFLYEKGRIVFDSDVPRILFLVLGVVLVGAIVFLSRRRFAMPPDARWGRWPNLLPIALRVLVLFLLLLAIAKPTLVVSTLLPHENIVAVLLDDSKSMTVKDEGDSSRFDQMKRLMSANSRFLDGLQSRFQTRFFKFSRQTEPLRTPSDISAIGSGTDLEESLKGVLSEFSSSPLVSVVILTDGADNLSRDLGSLLGQYRARKVAINAVGLGKTEVTPDIEVIQASAPQSVLPDSAVQAVVSVRSSGYAGEKARLEIRDAGRLVNSREVTLEGGPEPQMVEVDLQPRGKGLKNFTVAIEPRPGETIRENNSQSFLVNVEDARPKILYLEGTPRWEFKFIRQAVEKDKALQLVSLLRTSGNKFYRQGIEKEDNLASGFPTSKEELFEYKAVLLGSIESSFFSAEQERNISEFVSQRGGGFMMLGGKRSFDAGNYKGTPISDVLPVVLGQRGADSSYLSRLSKLHLTSYGRNHPVTRLVADPSQNERRWDSLPPVGDLNWVSTPKPGATVLATAEGPQSTMIVLAAHRFGRGRAIAFTPDSSWRWRMELPHTDDSHEVFWRQTLRWLVGSAPDRVGIELSKTVFHDDDTIRFEVEVNDPSFVPLNDAEVTATVTSPSGQPLELPLKWNGQKDGVYRAAFQPTEKGVHQIRVTAERAGKEIGQAQRAVLTAESNQEFYSPGQNRRLLEHVASETGGRYYGLSDANDLPEELIYQERSNSVPQHLALWDMPALFLLLLMFLIAEWGIRRKSGAV